MAQTPEQIKNYIKARLSLRNPQADSLDRLHYILEEFEDMENIPSDQLLQKIQSIASWFSWFDFNFPSMCFALATWVWKTRLMWAIIYYLHKVKWIRNFFVVAPNLTIYNKLREDFTYWSRKYVFKWLSDVDWTNPIIIDWDNYTWVNQSLKQWLFSFDKNFTINIFNISKFNSKKDTAKMKSFSEYIWESYYEYLQNLKDLVVLMDESHRYRADSSMQAINELKPILWFEFTATPYTVKWSKKSDFSNVLYRYNLANAIQDWYVKTPWVATRENVDVDKISKEELDFLKITDWIMIHERTKTELRLFADNNDMPYVKPFMMISAMDQNHADHIEELIKTRVLNWKYKDKIVKIYSWLWADEEENIEKLLEVEKADNPVEIVIQVMMLKEWWDVNNLYTIVPLRASASEILTEQTIWRWLRLPYWERVWDISVDRLTIVAHDRYQEVINAANKPDSLVKNVINLDTDNEITKKLDIVTSKPKYIDWKNNVKTSDVTKAFINDNVLTEQEAVDANNIINATVVKIIQNEQNTDLPNAKERIFNEAFNIINSSEDTTTKMVFWKLSEEQKKKLVEWRTYELMRDLSKYEILIPRVTFFRPDPDPKFNTDFKIDTSFLAWLSSQESTIRLQSLTSSDVERIKMTQQINFKWDVRDYFVTLMMDIPELDYDKYSEWMYNMANDLFEELKKTLWEKTDDEYKLHVHIFKDYITWEIKKQLLSKDCYSITIKEWEVRVNKWLAPLKWNTYSFLPWHSYDFRDTNFEKPMIKSYVFTWFSKTSEEYVKFDSDAERKLAVILENDDKVIKWIRPKSFTIDYYYNNTRSSYQPDFIAETEDAIYILEPKNASKVDDWEVQAKKQFTLEWINAVNNNTDWKEWKYAMIADNNIKETYTFDFITSLQA